MHNFIVVGSGGHSKVIIDTIKDIGYNVLGIIDINYNDKSDKNPILGIPIIGNIDILDGLNKNTNIILAIGDNELRKLYFNITKSKDLSIKTIVHNTAIISSRANIGIGTFINAGVIINADCNIGDNVIINTGAIIDHECEIEDHVHIGPGVKLAGKVKVGSGTFFGIGSCSIPKMKIGSNAMIGAGSVVIRDVNDNATVVGVPAKQIK